MQKKPLYIRNGNALHKLAKSTYFIFSNRKMIKEIVISIMHEKKIVPFISFWRCEGWVKCTTTSNGPNQNRSTLVLCSIHY